MADGETGIERKRMFVVLAVVAVALVALVAYLMWPRTPDNVLVVGDSVTYMSWDALNDQFDSETSLDPVARPGFTSTDLLPLVKEFIDRRDQAGHSLERAIFLVGYNDIWLGELGSDSLAELVELSARYECGVWLTVPARPAGQEPGVGDFDPELADEWNERLADLVGRHDNLHLVTEWADRIEEVDDPDIYLEPDGIHPNEEGQKLLAGIMKHHVVSDCRFP